MAECCKDCKFALITPEMELYCRRFPPQMVFKITPTDVGALAVFPAMNADRGWCGEFKQKLIFNS